MKRNAGEVRQVENYEELYWRFLFAAGVVLCLGTILLSAPAELWLQSAAVIVAVIILTHGLR